MTEVSISDMEMRAIRDAARVASTLEEPGSEAAIYYAGFADAVEWLYRSFFLDADK